MRTKTRVDAAKSDEIHSSVTKSMVIQGQDASEGKRGR